MLILDFPQANLFKEKTCFPTECVITCVHNKGIIMDIKARNKEIKDGEAFQQSLKKTLELGLEIGRIKAQMILEENIREKMLKEVLDYCVGVAKVSKEFDVYCPETIEGNYRHGWCDDCPYDGICPSDKKQFTD